MNKTIAATAALATVLGIAGTASAGHDRNPSPRVATYEYDLDAVQPDSVANSRATGSARITALPNGKIQVKVRAAGLAPGLPHAMHLHGTGADGGPDQGCPGPGADANADGVVTVLEGVPFYGGIQASLVEQGDPFDPANALNLADFAVADDDGRLAYSRTFPATQDVLAQAGTVQVVVHGIDIDADGEYDFDAGSSSLGEAFPLEATIPALCGGIAN